MMIELTKDSILANTLQGIKDLLHGGITPRNVKESRQLFVVNAQDSLDPDYPMLVPFNIPLNTTRVVRVNVTFWILPFRAYSKAALSNTQQTTSSGGGFSTTSASGGSVNTTTADGGGTTLTSASGGSTTPTSSSTTTPSGGGHTTPSGGGHTTPSGGGHTTPSGGGSTSGSANPGGVYATKYSMSGVYYVYDSGSSYRLLATGSSSTNPLEHTHSTPSHVHTVSSHVHTVSNHTHTVSNHTHPSHSHTVTIGSHTHGVTTPDHKHGVTISSHTHGVTQADHSHTVAAHDHAIGFGIYEENNSPTVSFSLSRDGVAYGDFVGSYAENQVSVEVSSLAGDPGPKVLKFESTARARLAVQVEVQLDMGR